MREAFIERCLQRVIGRVGNRVLSEDAAEHRNAVCRAASCGQRERITLRRGIPPKAYKRNVVRECGVRWNDTWPVWSVWNMQSVRTCDRSRRNDELSISEVRTASSRSEHVVNVETSLRIAVVVVVFRLEPVPLRPDVTNLELHIIRQL